jgi:transcription initiation protein SPT3
MMFVSGETQEPTPETTTLVEQVVKEQVKELVGVYVYGALLTSQLRRAIELAHRRGNRNITPDELMFLYRHDKAKLNRLLHFLQWKDVRKNVNEEGDRGGADGVEITAGEEALAAAGPGAGATVDPKKTSKKARVTLPWDVSSFFSVQVPPRDDEDDDEEREMNTATLERLKYADERTRNMSREDYMHWSECRQASFTYRKGKRFREWATMDQILGTKPNDDVMDILGFLTFEMVQTLTEEALKVKAEEDARKKTTGAAAAAGAGGEDGGGGGDKGGEGGGGGGAANTAEAKARKRKREIGLFDGPEEEREPVEPPHILESFRRLQKATPKQIWGSKVSGRPPIATLKLVRLFLFANGADEGQF